MSSFVSDVDQNLRAIPAGVAGEGTVAAVDGGLAYPPEDAGFGFDPRGVGAAYENNDVDPGTGTTLYDIDVERDVLVKQMPPNAGTSSASAASVTTSPTPSASTSRRTATRGRS